MEIKNSALIQSTIAAAPTKAEKESGAYGGGMAEKARVIRHALRNITTDLGTTNSTFIIVNQVYQSIGSYTGGIETPGGGGIKFHASVRAQLSKKSEVKDILPSGQEVTKAIWTEIHTVKNKLTLPKQKCQVFLHGERGFDGFETVAAKLFQAKLIRVNGGWKYLPCPKFIDEKIIIDKAGNTVPYLRSEYNLIIREKNLDPKLPDGCTFKLDEKGEVLKKETYDFVEVSFQSTEKLKEIIKGEKEQYYTEWMDYLVYSAYTVLSPLIKVKIIDKIWEYEAKFFKQRVTVLTEEEIEMAKFIFKEIQFTTEDSEEASIPLNE